MVNASNLQPRSHGINYWPIHCCATNADQLLAAPLSRNKCGQVDHSGASHYHQEVLLGSGQKVMTLSGWRRRK